MSPKTHPMHQETECSHIQVLVLTCLRFFRSTLDMVTVKHAFSSTASAHLVKQCMSQVFSCANHPPCPTQGCYDEVCMMKPAKAQLCSAPAAQPPSGIITAGCLYSSKCHQKELKSEHNPGPLISLLTLPIPPGLLCCAVGRRGEEREGEGRGLIGQDTQVIGQPSLRQSGGANLQDQGNS